MFDNIADLIDKIRLGEDSYLELKEVRFAGQKVSAPHKDSLADELAAFANSRGGVCMLGVDDTREVLGIPLERLDLVEDFVRQICLDSITPPLAPKMVAAPVLSPISSSKFSSGRLLKSIPASLIMRASSRVVRTASTLGSPLFCISGRVISNFFAVQGMIDTTKIFFGSIPCFWSGWMDDCRERFRMV